MADTANSGTHFRPLHGLLAFGRRPFCRPAVPAGRRLRGRQPAFASITSENSSSPRGGRNESINYSVFAPEETSSHAWDHPQTVNQDANARFSNLVKQESEPHYTVTFPSWMVELYSDLRAFGRAARRLFLPANSIKSKLPYYTCVPLHSWHCFSHQSEC
jgi:hypothetical protein